MPLFLVFCPPWMHSGFLCILLAAWSTVHGTAVSVVASGPQTYTCRTADSVTGHGSQERKQSCPQGPAPHVHGAPMPCASQRVSKHRDGGQPAPLPYPPPLTCPLVRDAPLAAGHGRVPCSQSGDVWLLCWPLKHTVPSWQLVSLRA